MPVKTLPMTVVAWFRLGEEDANAASGKDVVSPTKDHQGYFHLRPEANPVYSKNAAPNGSVLSIHFDGREHQCVTTSNSPYLMTDNFVLEAWACPRKIEKYPQFVVYNGNPNRNGFGLLILDGRWHYSISPIRMVDSGVRAVVGKWTHLALVCTGDRSQLWIDGRPVGKPFRGLPATPDTCFTIGTDHVNNPRMTFNGEIDEVRLLRLSGRFSPEMLLFHGLPSDKESPKRKSP
jgi:hypothetical protein